MHFTTVIASLVLAFGVQATPLKGASNGRVVRADDIYDRDFQNTMLEAHNLHRANHSAEPLVWDMALAEDAQGHTNTCLWQHTHAGQNLAKGYPFAYAAIHNGWYNGEAEVYEPFYGQPDVPEDIFHSIGHFTQMVWKSTKKLGCATTVCSGSLYTVCNYEPAGNYGGRYAEEVARPVGHASIHAP